MSSTARWDRWTGTSEDALEALARACVAVAAIRGIAYVRVSAFWDFDDGVTSSLGQSGWATVDEGANRLGISRGLSGEVVVCASMLERSVRLHEAAGFEMVCTMLACTIRSPSGEIVLLVDRDIRTLAATKRVEAPLDDAELGGLDGSLGRSPFVRSI